MSVVTVGALIQAFTLKRLKITVGCPPCTCPSIRVCGVCNLWRVCVLTWLCACDVCCGVYVVFWVLCDLLVVCGVVWCCVVLCGVCAWCGTLTHGGVCRLKTAHTEGFSVFSAFLALSLLSVCPSFSSLLLSSLFLSSLSCLLSLSLFFSATMTMITRPVGSLSVYTRL